MVSAGDVIRASDLVMHACRVTRTTNMAVNGPSIDTVVPFTSEVFDIGGMHDNSVNNSRITFQRAGVYVVGGGIQLSAGANYVYSRVQIRINGGNIIMIDTNAGTTSSISQHSATASLYQFAAGDYIELIVSQSSGANRTLEVAGDYSPVFWASQVA